MKAFPQLVLLAIFLCAPNAFANFGWVIGTLKFDSQQGNFCDTTQGMNCFAARFPASNSMGLQPVRDTEIVLSDSSGPIGFGSTDRNGVYLVRWETDGATPSSINVRWNLRHKDGRFSVTTSTGSLYVGDFTTFTPVHNSTIDAGTIWWSYTEPTNIYDGAQRTWWESLRYSNLMLSRFTSVALRWPDTLAGVNNAAALGASKVIAFNGNNAQRPQARVSHEMGHIASYLAEPFSACVAYNYPSACSTSNPGTTCTGGWDYTTSEHYCAGFEEAIATFIGDVSYYWFDATQPTTCRSVGVCNAAGSNVETSPGSGIGCTAAVRHQPMNGIKYLWDAYDSVNDASYNDAVTHSYDQMILSLDSFLSTTVGNANVGNGGVDEPWDTSTPRKIDDVEGRSARDYRKYLPNTTSTQYSENCSPGHD